MLNNKKNIKNVQGKSNLLSKQISGALTTTLNGQ